jgi:hypothetical protein
MFLKILMYLKTHQHQNNQMFLKILKSHLNRMILMNRLILNYLMYLKSHLFH